MTPITDIREVQKIALDILLYVDKICREHQIPYYLAGGTLLGAARHQGFIPWDDDIDIMIPRADYERFLTIMDETQNEQYKCLYSCAKYPHYCLSMAKVVDTRTIELTNPARVKYDYKGVNLDVFPIDKIDENKYRPLIRKAHFYCGMANTARAKKIFIPHKSKKIILARLLLTPLAKLMGCRYWLRRLDKLIQRQNAKAKGTWCTLYGGHWLEKEMFPAEYLNEVTTLTFAGHQFPVFKNYAAHLTHLYGDWQQLPPADQRLNHGGDYAWRD